MIYIDIPDKNRLTAFYLSAEEYVAQHIDTQEDCFFMWQVPPTVMIGRNQLLESEVNIPYCKEHHIQIIRRKSGGGCIYVDSGCILFSCITHDNEVNLVFSQYINRIVKMLNSMNIPAKPGGRNDIMLDGKKNSGNAFYHVPGRSIVHGTMLYDTHLQNMVASITPSEEKLISKGVQSVHQHIALLKDYTSISIDDFKEYAKKYLCSKTIRLTQEDLKGVEDIEKDYLSPEFIYSNNPRYSIINKKRIENVGELEVRIGLKNNIIKHINIIGDYFLTGDLDNAILKPLQNVECTAEAVNAALPNNVEHVIRNLSKAQLVNLITVSNLPLQREGG